MVLKWFYSPRAVGAPLSEVKCALSALLVIITIFLLAILAMSEKVAFVCSCVCDTRIDGQTDAKSISLVERSTQRSVKNQLHMNISPFAFSALS